MTYNPAILAAGSDVSLEGVATPSAKLIRGYATQGSVTTTDPPPPEEGWPDPFMSYPLSPAIYLEGVNGATISQKSFQDITRANGTRPIHLNNCSNITIERIDTRGCTMGLLYAYNCNNITVRYCRVENFAYEFIDHTLHVGNADAGIPGYFRNLNDCNVFQINIGNEIHVSDIKARYGNNEDAFSFYDVTNSTATRIQYEGAITDDRPTSDGRRSTYWTSSSGTAFILGDSPGTGGYNLTVTDSTFIEPGQVGTAIACGYNNRFDNCIIMGTGDPPQIHPETWHLNTPAYVYPAAQGCSEIHDNFQTNCRGWFANLNNAYMPGGFNTDLTGSNFVDGSLNVEDYRVTL